MKLVVNCTLPVPADSVGITTMQLLLALKNLSSLMIKLAQFT